VDFSSRCHRHCRRYNFLVASRLPSLVNLPVLRNSHGHSVTWTWGSFPPPAQHQQHDPYPIPISPTPSRQSGIDTPIEVDHRRPNISSRRPIGRLLHVTSNSIRCHSGVHHAPIAFPFPPSQKKGARRYLHLFTADHVHRSLVGLLRAISTRSGSLFRVGTVTIHVVCGS